MARKAGKATARKAAKAPLRERVMKGVPDDLWVKCTGCSTMLYSKELEQSLKVCQKCGHHLRLSAEERIRLLVDEGSFQERDTDLATRDPLSFPAYKEDIARHQRQTGQADSMVWGEAAIGERPIILGVSEFGFMGGSMGSVMGEKVVRAAEEAAIKRQPLVLVCSGGGARMHEGIISLMQMARTTAAMARLTNAKVPYIAIFADPMLAGIAASFAFIADIIIAEPGAIVGFAGPRVVEQAYRIKLPPGSMTAEFHLSHGMVDMVLPRKEIRPMLIRLMDILR
jgi:acetyl-CoA carboxylase carboxyl transferase subunit beta